MKRTELVEKIAEDLLMETTLYGGDKAEREEVREATKFFRIMAAHQMLKTSEKYKMLPPFTSIVDVDGIVKETGHIWDK